MHDKMLKNGYFDLKMTIFRYHLQNGVILEFFCNNYPILTSKLLFILPYTKWNSTFTVNLERKNQNFGENCVFGSKIMDDFRLKSSLLSEIGNFLSEFRNDKWAFFKLN